MKSAAIAQKSLVVALLCAALVASGCGDSSKSTDSSDAAAPTPAASSTQTDSDRPQAATPADNSEAAQKKAIISTVSAAMTTIFSDSPEDVCDLISKAGMKKMLASATMPDGKKATSCEAMTKAQASSSKPSAEQRKQAEITIRESLKSAKVEIDGDTAVVRTGETGTGSTTYLVKEDGRWKISQP